MCIRDRLWFVLSGQKNRTRVDRSAQYMGIGKDVEALTEKAAQATAQRLGVAGSVGVPIGTHLYSGKPLFGSWEDMHIDIWGPRTGKALDFSTKVLTPHGWVEIGTLTRGCRVIGRDGQAHTAVSYTHLDVYKRQSQDSAFAAALPLGIVLSKHINIPAVLRNNI